MMNTLASGGTTAAMQWTGRALLCGLLIDACGQLVAAQTATAPTVLSLPDAVARAVGESEEVKLAEAVVASADTGVTTARAAGLPQLSTSGGYVRTFQSPLRSGFSLPSVPAFTPDPTAPVEA